MTITRLPPVRCPICHGILDAHGDEAAGRALGPPAAGDYTVCLYCTSILKFDEACVPRALSPAEEAEVARDAEVRRVQAWVQRRTPPERN